MLFTDIVGSTERASSLGDRERRHLLARHHASVRRELARFRGKEIRTTGDGFLATFDGPARAVRCAEAVRNAVRDLGLEVRSGLHTGEIEVLPNDVGGIAVHVAARVVQRAAPGEVLTSSVIRDLVAGSGLRGSWRSCAQGIGRGSADLCCRVTLNRVDGDMMSVRLYVPSTK